jgi:hypothetical protein
VNTFSEVHVQESALAVEKINYRTIVFIEFRGLEILLFV